MDVQEDLDVNNVFDNEKKEVSNSMNKQRLNYKSNSYSFFDTFKGDLKW